MTFRNFKRSSTLRSGLEDTVAKQLKDAGIGFEYEDDPIPYFIEKHYVPDFRLPNGIIIETKGWFDEEDKRKMREVKKQHPELDIRFVFSSINGKTRKQDKMTYEKWCKKYKFPCAQVKIPEAWLREVKDAEA